MLTQNGGQRNKDLSFKLLKDGSVFPLEFDGYLCKFGHCLGEAIDN